MVKDNAGSASLPERMKAFGMLFGALAFSFEPTTAFVCTMLVAFYMSHI